MKKSKMQRSRQNLLDNRFEEFETASKCKTNLGIRAQQYHVTLANIIETKQITQCETKVTQKKLKSLLSFDRRWHNVNLDCI